MNEWLGRIVFGLLVVPAFGFFAYRLQRTWKQLHTLAKGKEEARPPQLGNMVVGGLLQRKMFQDPVAGVMHAGIFWGFLLVSLGTLETFLQGFLSVDFGMLLGTGFLYASFLHLQELGNAMVAVAILFAFSRRLFFPPPRLVSLSRAAKQDAMLVLSFILSLVVSALMVLGCRAHLAGAEGIESTLVPISFWLTNWLPMQTPESWAVAAQGLWWWHVATLCGFVAFLPFSKHQHLIWVWPNLLFQSAKGSGRLRPMEFAEDAESFGVGQADGFTWKQYLDGISCVECGRCTAVCPATATGKPLDPRKMIHHLKDAFGQLQTPEKPAIPLIGEQGLVHPDELWSCTTCGACMQACPLGIEHIPAIMDMRRYLTLTEGNMPSELQATLAKVENKSNPWGFTNSQRADWAKDLEVPILAEKKSVDYLFWVGCAGSFDERYKKVSRDFTSILKKANVDFAILGTEERCNGDIARRSGNEYLADMQIRGNIETLKKYDFKKVVTACPHCFNTFKNEYPDFDYKVEVMHHSQLLADLVKDKRIAPTQTSEQTVTYHDSCYLGRHNDEYASPRETIASTHKNIVEMPRNKEKGFCCGAGGARMWMEETIGERINVNRAQEAVDTGAQVVATACPFCMTMVRDGVQATGKGENVVVKDIAELLAESL